MAPFHCSVTEVIRQRFSCRAYQKLAIPVEKVNQLEMFIADLHSGPLNTPFRFELALAMPHNPKALQGLGTYGLIKDPAGFIIGAADRGPNYLEDFGYGMEFILLYATSIGIDTCWLGGNFTKSSFSQKIHVNRKERVPAVASFGCSVEGMRTRDQLRKKVKSDQRLPWETMFFQSSFCTPLSQEEAGDYAVPLEMLRLAPSSHNYQPWRIVQDGSSYHFYLQRTAGFGPKTPMFILLGVADLQRMEIGIAMCHFELAARELNLTGKWEVHEPTIQQPAIPWEYVVTWISTSNPGQYG